MSATPHKLILALDSGAYSILRRRVGAERLRGASVSAQVAAGRRKDSTFYDTDEYDSFVSSYAAYVKANQSRFDFCATLDVIFDPERTWLTTQRLEKLGAKVMPVFHYGEDLQWLKKYVDRYEYVGVGGLAKLSTARRAPFLNQVFRITGPAKTRVHGFGVTTVSVMRHWPWYSVDSTSPLRQGATGSLYLPAMHGAARDFKICAGYTSITSRKAGHTGSLYRKGNRIRAQAESYVNWLGKSLDGLADNITELICINLITFAYFAKSAGVNMYFSGTYGGVAAAALPSFARLNLPFRWLGSFAFLDFLNRLTRLQGT